MLRKLIERASRNIVLKRRMPPLFGGGPIFVSPDAALGFWKWKWEDKFEDLFVFAKEFVRAGDSVWDIGANMGIFAFASSFQSGQSGSVIAIEPDDFCVGVLRRSAHARRKQGARVAVVAAAVGDSIGIEDFQVADRGRSTNHLVTVQGSTQTGGIRETISVITITLDWLLKRFPSPRVVKIDVEGAEWKVFQGAPTLLSRVRPTLLCEISSQNADRCASLLRSHGYRLYDFDHRDKGEIVGAAYNTLAIPTERQTE